jgi:hypothetical protein
MSLPKMLNRIGWLLCLVGAVNFMVFFVVALCIGGDAINGKVENGRYYLSSHGRLTEVSPRVWQYSRFHTISVWITHPLAIFGGGGLIALSLRMGKAT